MRTPQHEAQYHIVATLAVSNLWYHNIAFGVPYSVVSVSSTRLICSSVHNVHVHVCVRVPMVVVHRLNAYYTIINLTSAYPVLCINFHPSPVFSPSKLQGMIGRHGVGGACILDKAFGLSPFPISKRILY